MSDLHWVLLIVAGYSIGSLPFAVLVAKLYRLPDPRNYGSGNPGATNVMRSGHKKAARIVFGLDLGKGLLPTTLGHILSGPTAAAIAGLAAVVGHVWPITMRFQGGKGVSTNFGLLLALDYRLAAGAGVAWLGIYLLAKSVSLASLASCCVATLLAIMLYGLGNPVGASVGAAAMLIVIRHKKNIRSFAAGRNDQFSQTRSTRSSATSTTKKPPHGQP